MEHQEALPFVSAVLDGQTVPAEASRHIQACSECLARLHEYVEMGAELRLVAAALDAEVEERQCSPPPVTRFSFWAQAWKARVPVPRLALALGIVAIVALSVGFGYLQAQGHHQVFHFVISSPQAEGIEHWGANVPIGGEMIYGAGSPKGTVWALFRVLGIREGVLRLAVQARRFDSKTSGTEAKRALADVPAREYKYIPGDTLEIAVADWGTLSLKGEYLDQAAKFPWENPSIEPWPNEIMLKGPALVKGKELVFQSAELAAEAAGENPTVSLYAPGEGRFVFRLQPFEGAVEGLAEYGHARFQLNGQDYFLSCATPITGGQQPRQIWVYLDRSYRPENGQGEVQGSPGTSSAPPQR
jgi:hypothetical protein